MEWLLIWVVVSSDVPGDHPVFVRGSEQIQTRELCDKGAGSIHTEFNSLGEVKTLCIQRGFTITLEDLLN